MLNNCHKYKTCSKYRFLLHVGRPDQSSSGLLILKLIFLLRCHFECLQYLSIWYSIRTRVILWNRICTQITVTFNININNLTKPLGANPYNASVMNQNLRSAWILGTSSVMAPYTIPNLFQNLKYSTYARIFDRRCARSRRVNAGAHAGSGA